MQSKAVQLTVATEIGIGRQILLAQFTTVESCLDQPPYFKRLPRGYLKSDFEKKKKKETERFR